MKRKNVSTSAAGGVCQGATQRDATAARMDTPETWQFDMGVTTGVCRTVKLEKKKKRRRVVQPKTANRSGTVSYVEDDDDEFSCLDFGNSSNFSNGSNGCRKPRSNLHCECSQSPNVYDHFHVISKRVHDVSQCW